MDRRLHVTAPVIYFADLVILAKGFEGEADRQRRIAIRRQAAYRRAFHDAAGGQPAEYSMADAGMFGPIRQLLTEGPGEDPRLEGYGSA
jgi:hypothetical protein